MSEAPPHLARTSQPPPDTTLSPEQAARLTEFARACKAAVRAVLLYPAGHPAIAATVGRIAALTGPPAMTEPLKVTVLPAALLIDGRAPARLDAAVSELAALLHERLIGELTVQPGGDVEAWRAFLLLLGRDAASIHTEGGVARLWTTSGGRHIELREIDYAEVLRERTGGHIVVSERLVANCLQGDALELDDDALRAVLEIAGNSERLAELLAAVGARAVASGGIPAQAAALLRMLRGIIDALGQVRPERGEPLLRNVAAAIGQVSPEVMVDLLSHRTDPGDARIVGEVVRHMSDESIAHFVAGGVAAEGTATDRLAQAFHALVPDRDHRRRLLALAHDELAASSLAEQAGFESMWTNVSEMLTSYSDASFVSETYGRELSSARAQAIEVERVGDDPPERMAAWLGTVATSAVRALDLALLVDLLRIEEDATRWRDLVPPVVGHVEDLLLVGDFEAAAELAAILAREAGPGGRPGRKAAASRGLELLVSGSMLRHIVSHLTTIDETQFERVRSLCLAIGGEVLVRPLAEALSTEEQGRARDRLAALLIAFGASGRQAVERLKSSPNAAVRRTAIYLLREFGGTDALPDLTLLIDDAEPQVQREAVHAIVNIGTDAAYHVLHEALARGTPESRDRIVQAIALVRDERATPLFAYLIRHVDHRGPLGPIYLRAIESLGALHDPSAVGALKEALYRGEWWAPRRTALLRGAAAAALGRIGTRDAVDVLRHAVASGRRGVRAAARPHLERSQEAHGR